MDKDLVINLYEKLTGIKRDVIIAIMAGKGSEVLAKADLIDVKQIEELLKKMRSRIILAKQHDVIKSAPARELNDVIDDIENLLWQRNHN